MKNLSKTAFFTQINAQINNKNYKEAIRLARMFLETYPNTLEPHLALGTALLSNKDYDKSRRALLRAIEKFPHQWQLHDLLGDSYFFLNRIQEAENAYRTAIIEAHDAEKEEQALLHYQLGDTLWVQNKRAFALEEWKRAVEIDPECIVAKEALEECTNEYGEPKGPNPIFDDLYHFQGIHIQRYLALVARNEFCSSEEMNEVLKIIQDGWNQHVVPRSKEMDEWTTEERSNFFKSITLNFTDTVMRWKRSSNKQKRAIITAAAIEQTVEKISAMNRRQTETLARRMGKEQPYLLVYLAAATEGEEFTDDEADVFFNIATVIWQTMRQHPNGARLITEEIVEAVEKENEELLLKLEKDSEGDLYSVAETMALNYPEPELFRFIVQSLFEDDEENLESPLFSNEHLGAAFLQLKIALDAFIAVQR